MTDKTFSLRVKRKDRPEDTKVAVKFLQGLGFTVVQAPFRKAKKQ